MFDEVRRGTYTIGKSFTIEITIVINHNNNIFSSWFSSLIYIRDFSRFLSFPVNQDSRNNSELFGLFERLHFSFIR